MVTLIERHLEVSERGLRGSARGAKLQKQKKRKVGQKKLEVSVSSAPEPQRPHHEGAFQGGKPFN